MKPFFVLYVKYEHSINDGYIEKTNARTAVLPSLQQYIMP